MRSPLRKRDFATYLKNNTLPSSKKPGGIDGQQTRREEHVANASASAKESTEGKGKAEREAEQREAKRREAERRKRFTEEIEVAKQSIRSDLARSATEDREDIAVEELESACPAFEDAVKQAFGGLDPNVDGIWSKLHKRP